MIACWIDSRVSVSDGRMSRTTAASAGAVTRAELARRSRERQLRIDDLERLDARLTCEQVAGAAEQHRGGTPADVRLAFGVGLEGVEDAECRRPEPDRKERRRPGLLPDDRHHLPDQLLDGFLLSGLRLEPNEQADHGTLHPPPRPGSRATATIRAQTVRATERPHPRRSVRLNTCTSATPLQARHSHITADESRSEPSSND